MVYFTAFTLFKLWTEPGNEEIKNGSQFTDPIN